MKKRRILASIALAAAAAFSLASCNGDAESTTTTTAPAQTTTTTAAPAQTTTTTVVPTTTTTTDGGSAATTTTTTQESYTITFDANGKEVTDLPSALTNQTAIPDNLTTLANLTDYDFVGWGLTADATTPVTAGTQITSSTTLYAIWSATSFTITFDANGKEVTDLPADLEKQKTIPSNLTPLANISGYNFVGWGTTADATTPVTAGTALAGTTVLFAIWQQTYTIAYNANGKTITDLPASLTDQVAIPTDLPTLADLADYHFAGWATSADSTDLVKAGSSINKATTLYALWSPFVTMNGTKYPTIKAALSAISKTSTDTFEIILPKGAYFENHLTYSGSANIVIKGDTDTKYGADVIIKGHGEDMASEKSRELLEIEGTGNITLINLTMVSDWSRADHTGDVQAEVLGTDTKGYTVAYNCGFKSHQDTLRTSGKAWFYGCYVEGDTDFMWMESSGIVALYEKCEIVSVYDEYTNTHRSYLTAPRMSVTQKVGKGLVIYNSTVREAKAEQETYLARTPWKSGYYNQVAYINTDCEGVQVSDTIGGDGPWYQKQIATEFAKTVIGWKMDQATANSIGYSGNEDILDADTVSKEFNGRETILNRIYNTGKQKYEKDVINYWDISDVITANGFTVDLDESKSKLDGEVEGVTTTYVFDGTVDVSAYTTTFTQDGTKAHFKGTDGATITIPVSGKCYVEVYGYYTGTVETKADTQGSAVMFFNNGTTNSEVECDYAVYDANATSVVITAKGSGTTYITKIVVVTDDSIVNTPVTNLEITGNTTNYCVGVSLKLSAKVTPTNATNKSVIWSSSDSTIGSIDPYTGKVTFLKDGTVTFTATACDGSGVFKTITCKPINPTWTKAEWYTTDDVLTTETGALEIANFGVGDATTDKQIKNNDGKSVTYSFVNLDGKTISTSRGLKLNAGGLLTIATTKPSAELTLYVGPHQNLATDAPKVYDENDNVVTPTSSTEVDGMKVYVYELDHASTWNIERATINECSPIVYAKCEYTDPVIKKDTSLLFGTDGNYAEAGYFKITADVSSSQGNNSQLKNGNIEFTVEAGATVEVYANWGEAYIINDEDDNQIEHDGTNVGNAGKRYYQYSKKTTITIQCDPKSTGHNYFYWIKVTFPTA